MEETNEQSISSAAAHPSRVSLIKDGFRFVWNRLDLLFTAFAVQFVVGLYVFVMADKMEAGSISGVEVVLFALSAILAGIVGFINGMIIMYVGVSNESGLRYRDGVRWVKEHFWKYLWIIILSSVITTAGFFLFIVPGIILSVYFALALVVYILEAETGMGALLRSRQLIEGNWWRTVVLFLLIFLFAVLVGIVAGIIAVVVGGLAEAAASGVGLTIVSAVVDILLNFGLTMVLAVVLKGWYEELKVSAAIVEASVSEKRRKLYIVLGWLGLIMLLLLPLGMMALMAGAIGLS